MASPHTGSVSRSKGPDGRWRGRVMVAGRVYAVSSSDGRADCRRRLNRRIAEVTADGFVPPPLRATAPPSAPPPVAPVGPRTAAHLLTDWLRDRGASLRSTTSHDTYERVIRRYLVPALGAVPVDELRPEHVRALHRDLAALGHAAATIRLTHTVLRTALRDAERDGSPIAASLLRVRGPALRPAPPRWPSPEQLGALIGVAAADRQFGAIVVVAALTGLRIAEVLGLLVDDVDLAAGRIGLTHQLGRDGQRRQLKTESSRRELTIAPTVVDAVERHLIWRAEAQVAAGDAWRDTEGLLFTTARGAPLHHELVRRAFKAALTRAGLPDVRFHALRHGHAMTLRKAGVDLHTIKDRLGHANIATTSSRYLHVDPELDRDASDRAERRMGLGRAGAAR